jgi:membrane-associated protein
LELLDSAWQFIAHPDQQLAVLLKVYGTWIYGLLFLVLFCETGLVVTPFLPGDSLLFVAGALWASAGLDIRVLAMVLVVAVLCGDNCNYWIGRRVGRRIAAATSRWINRRALERTQAFYARHGGKTIVIARFVPIVRTFAPFVAGLGHMHYPRFLAFSIGGAVFWVVSLLTLGYWFGNVGFVRENFGIVTVVIVVLSIAPIVVEFVRHRRKARAPLRAVR